MVVGLKDLLTAMGELTARVRLKAGLVSPRVLPMAPSFKLLLKICEVPLIAGTITFTLSVQVPPWPMVPPVSVSEVSSG